MNFRPILPLAFVAISLTLNAAEPAQAVTTIDFGGNTGCETDSSSYCRLAQSYGDTAEVDVSYASIFLPTGARGLSVYRYGVGYGDLSGIVFGGRNKTEYATEITLAAAAGFELSLLDFDFASFAGRSPTTPFRITDLAGNVVSEGMRSTGMVNGHANYAVNSAFGSGVVIRWGPDGHEVGLDNIRFDVRSVAGAVPEPGAWVMMILGFGVVGATLRQSRSAKLAIAR